MDEARKIGLYTVIYEMEIGHKCIAVGKDVNAKENERYLCCYVESNLIFERYENALVSDDYAEIMRVFGERIHDAAEEIIAEHEQAEKRVGDISEILTNKCDKITDADCIENKVVVIRGDALRPEYKYSINQLMLCTGGFGSQAFSRGRTCYCINLYTGEKTSYYRSDILGTIQPKNLPEWAKHGFEKAKEIQHKKQEYER